MNPHESKDGVSEDPRIAGVLHELPNWAHYLWLIYLVFVFTPAFSPDQHAWGWLWPTIASLVVFVFLYDHVVRVFRYRTVPPGRNEFAAVLGMAMLAYILAPFNDSANTYVIFCATASPFTLPSLRRVAMFVAALLGGYAIELSILGFRPVMFAITAVVATVAAFSNFMMVENRRKNVALRLSREEVHRMARVAERERIGRDLHDLLGHTLSLIAIKSELAAKLLERDRAAAAREVGEVTSIAREALKQVRIAVSGIRAAALENEVASARALLSTAGITLTFQRDGAVLPAEMETALAMIVREAVTNIQRHSRAREANIEVITQPVVAADGGARVGEKMVVLRVSDDGCGGIATTGNGLAGIAERVRCLGGALEIDSPRGKGTTLRARLPLAESLSGKRAHAGSPLAVHAAEGSASRDEAVGLREQPVSTVRA
jgi:two-component system, NarL family, sensor histidine kinase DesK